MAGHSSPSGNSSIVRLDDVGIYVQNLEAAMALFEGGFKLTLSRRMEKPGMRVCFYLCGQVEIELVELADEAERGRHVGEGVGGRLDHLAVEVINLQAAARGLANQGVLFQSEKPSRTAGGMALFTRPETSGGVVYQLLQKAR